MEVESLIQDLVNPAVSNLLILVSFFLILKSDHYVGIGVESVWNF